MSEIILICPVCGKEIIEFFEGYCENCCQEHQSNLDMWNIEYDMWNKKTNVERDAAIKWALR